jgi:hypothetical protein
LRSHSLIASEPPCAGITTTFTSGTFAKVKSGMSFSPLPEVTSPAFSATVNKRKAG